MPDTQTATLLRMAWELLRGPAPEDAAAALAAEHHLASREALADALERPTPAKLAALCASALAPQADAPDAARALRAALEASPHALARTAAARALDARWHERDLPLLRRRLLAEPSGALRRALLRPLADLGDRDGLALALDDPYWRVRDAALQHIEPFGERDPAWADALLAATPRDAREEGALGWLRWRWRRPAALRGAPWGQAPPDAPSPGRWWSEDPPVLRARLAALSEDDLRAALPDLLGVLGSDSGGARTIARAALARWADAPLLADALALMADPRLPEAPEEVARLLASLELDRRDALIALADPATWSANALRWALAAPSPRRRRLALAAWERPEPALRADALAALDDPGDRDPRAWSALRADDDALQAAAIAALAPHTALSALWGALPALVGPRARRAWAAALAGQPRASAALPGLRALLGGDDAPARATLAPLLARDPDALPDDLRDLQTCDDQATRAAAMTPQRAALLWEQPWRESSWRVLSSAAALLRRPLQRALVALGGPLQPPPRAAYTPAHVDPAPPQPPPARRPLGGAGLFVSPLGISGHYGLPREGFARAIEAGVNLFFWEPAYHAQTALWSRDLTPARRAELHLVCGSFQAEPARIRADLDYALKALRVERVSLFMIFWVRDPERLGEPQRAVLEEAQRQGLIGAYGFSTHQRALAMRALDDGWGALLVRHSAAHRGAEGGLLPAARDRGLGVITFNNLCYGRLLRDPRDPDAPGARPLDAYRYSLSQPGVAASMSAPRDLRELEENLPLLTAAPLPDADQERLRALGDAVYAQNTTFARLVRWR